MIVTGCLQREPRQNHFVHVTLRESCQSTSNSTLVCAVYFVASWGSERGDFLRDCLKFQAGLDSIDEVVGTETRTKSPESGLYLCVSEDYD